MITDAVLEPPAPRSTPTLRWRDDTGEHVLEIRERTILGSSPDAGVVIAASTVSRIHAEIEPLADGLWARDLGSRNGTFVQEVKITRARVPDGGSLRLGTASITVSYGVARAPAELWPSSTFGPLFGASAIMRELFARLAKAAKTTSSIVVTGETGSGKELIARAIHEGSPRSSGPFVVVDCAVLADSLLQSELFGHVRGSFTGAVADRAGAFEQADGGTIFLDEIGELATGMQPKLLRVLESRSVQRIGETRQRPIDVRVIAATHRDLEAMVSCGAFREDLYFRLSVLPVRVPALRERRPDIPALLARFLPADVQRTLDPAVLFRLAERPWLGNVRELRNFAERVVAFGIADAVAALDAAVPPLDSAEPRDLTGTYREFRDRWLERGERAYLEALLARHDRNVARAAEEAGVDRTHLYRLLRRHAL